ncbi:MAG TPA: ATP-binding protein [Candidatus Methylomirabilis sp.]|nr:ATP-binding protein [Candidatus Methylomirabilis sp.]
MRTKFLLGLVTVLAGLTCVTLLIVQRFAVTQAQREVEESARNAILTFQLLQQKSHVELSRKADLLAMLVSMRNGDATSIDEVSEDPWLSDTCTLVVLADRTGKITASRPAMDAAQAKRVGELLRLTPKSGNRGVWWLNAGRLYQVVLQPYFSDPPQNKMMRGTVLVGREMDATRAAELGRISSSQVMFRQGDTALISTVNPMEEAKLARELEHGDEAERLDTERGTFYAKSVALDPAFPAAVTFTALESYAGPMASLGRLNRVLVGVGLAAMLAGLALAFVIAERFTRPLANLAEGVRALQRGDFGYPLEANGNDEVTRVTRAFDEMRRTLQANETQRHQLEDQLRQSQKMDALGRLAGGVAHDFNNLLTVIKGHGDVLQDRLQPNDPLQSSSKQIAQAAERAAGLTRQLLAFCRMQMLEPKVVDLNALVSEMCKLLRRLVREDIAFSFHAGESLGRVKADPGQLEQVLINLTVNACDAMPQGGKLSIATRNMTADEKFAAQRTPLKPGEYVVISVADTGCGMDAATKSRIFEPFFTTKDQGKGTGLGLSTVYGVVKQSGGYIWVESEPGHGAQFDVFLPRVSEEKRTAVAQEQSGPARRKGTVLLAEDEEGVRELASQFLSSAGYHVLRAGDGVEALAIAEEFGKTIHVLVTDVVMPRMRGPELARQLKKARSNIKVLYVSGYLEFNKGNSEFLEEGFFLQKPFSRDVLVRKVDEVLKSGRPTAADREAVSAD